MVGWFLPAIKQVSMIRPRLEAPKDTFREEGRKGRRVRGLSPHGKKRQEDGKGREGERGRERKERRGEPKGPLHLARREEQGLQGLHPY